MNKRLNCKLVYTNETKENLRLESQTFTNSRVILAKREIPIALMGLPTSCKRYGNGASLVAVKVKFYTTTVTRSGGEGKQLVGYVNLNRSMGCDLNNCNIFNIYKRLLSSDFL